MFVAVNLGIALQKLRNACVGRVLPCTAAARAALIPSGVSAVFKGSGIRRIGAGTLIFGLILLILGVAIFAGGVWLIALGGSWYYGVAGIGLMAAGIGVLDGSIWGLWLYFLTYAFTWVWAVAEAGWSGWELMPRILAPTILAIVALLFIPVLSRRRQERVLAAGRPQHAEGVAAPRASQSRSRRTPEKIAGIFLVLAAGGFLIHWTGNGNAQEAATLTPGAAPPASQNPLAETGSDWPAYGGTNHALRYTSLDQITPGNAGQLTRVWTYRTGDLPDDKAKGKYSPETTPIKVGDRLYLCSAKNIVIALDAATGKEEWRYDPKVSDDAIPYGATCRGVAYYKNPAALAGTLCAARILEATLDARLLAVDTETGKPCPEFGNNGSVDLTEGIGETTPGWYGNVAAPTIVRNIIVLGAQVQDGQAADAPSGVIRGYDVVTGKLAWAWDMGHPERTGAPPPGETYTRGTPNMWTSAAGDDALGYVYVPLGNAAGDYYGSERKDFENEFNSSLVAIDVTTGKPVWHFQTVHYDVWDYDLGSQPTLVDIRTSHGTVPAIIQASKQGEIYVLDRRTGTSLFPVEERKVPSGGVEAAKLSPTQPFSGFHSVAKPALTEKDMWGMSPLDQLWCRIQFRRASYQGRYTPPTTQTPYLEYPSYNGGSDWGSVAVDPIRGVLIVNYNNMANYNRLLSRNEANDLGLKPIDVPHKPMPPGIVEYGPQAGLPYAIQVNPGWQQHTGLMCTRPPYGGITAIELATGKTLWDEPLGEARENGPFGIPSMLPLTIGTPNNGGALVTAGGLIFIAAATDNLIRAIDINTGNVVWKDTLPAGGQANPMAFEVNGREFIGFMAGGHHFMHTPAGDYVLAYALPQSAAK
jgi:quinoprotein glucose dehydrogenase